MTLRDRLFWEEQDRKIKTEYMLARREHAFLLRCEGLSYNEISRRIGVSPGTLWYDVLCFSISVAEAVRPAKIRWKTK